MPQLRPCHAVRHNHNHKVPSLILAVQETFKVGEDTYLDSVSPKGTHAVVFEDNEETGYFYAAGTHPDLQVFDALHVYNVVDVADKGKLCKAQIVWSEDGMKAALLINNYCHAVFDFVNKAGYCRNGFPEPNSEWTLIKQRVLTNELIDDVFGTA
jgi:hypothetical protein